MFFVYLVHIKRLKEVYLHFMIAGHTKFSCDAMFGTLANLLKRIMLKNLSQIAKMINERSTVYKAKVMKPNLCLDFKKGLADKAKKIKGITKFHHFKISNRNNDVVFEVKKTSGDDWKEIWINYDKKYKSFSDIPQTGVEELNEDLQNGLDKLKSIKPYNTWSLEAL